MRNVLLFIDAHVTPLSIHQCRYRSASYLFLHSGCFRKTLWLMEAAVSGLVYDVRQRPRTIRPDVRLVVLFSLRHETVRQQEPAHKNNTPVFEAKVCLSVQKDDIQK